MVSHKSPPILERRNVSKGQILIKEGEEGTQAYLIQSGEVCVFVSKDGVDVELSRLGAGQIVGEMAVIGDGTRTASVRAVTDCNVIAISRQQFDEKLKESDATVRAIVHMLSDRVLESNNVLMNKKSGVGDLKKTARTIYKNIIERLNPHQQRNFQNTVLPHLEALLDSVDTFQDRYGEQPE